MKPESRSYLRSAACGILGAALVTCCLTWFASTARAGSLQVTESTKLPLLSKFPDNPEIFDARSSPEGGLLLAGRQGTSRALTARLTDGLQVEWSNALVQPGWPAYGTNALVNASDGGYWAVGYGYVSPTGYDFVARFDKAGKRLWQRNVLEGAWHRLYCVRETNDGLVVLGHAILYYPVADDSSRTMPIDVPWLAKLDKEGAVLWQQALSAGGDTVLNRALDVENPACRGLQVADSGTITVATTVREVQGTNIVSGHLVIPSHYSEAPAGTLVVQTNSAGQILDTFRTQAADEAFLFPTRNGLSLVEHMRPGASSGETGHLTVIDVLTLAKRVIGSSGVRVTEFDDRLKALKTDEVRLPALSNRLSAVEPASSGGFFVAGCDSNSVNSIGLIDPSGSVVTLQQVFASDRANQCAKIGLARSTNDGEFMALFASGLAGNILLKMRAVSP